MRSALRGSLFGLVVLLLLAAIGARAGVVAIPLARPAGHGLWLASRAGGIAAYVALAAEILFGLFLSTAAADRWIARARSAEIHRWLSAVALATIGAHAAALLGDRYVRFDALDVLVPFVASYRRLAVGLGSLAFWAALVVHASFSLRKRLGQRAWRLLHYLSFAAFGFATAHGLLAGSDAGLGWMRALYLGSAGLVLWLTAYRAIGALAAARQ